MQHKPVLSIIIATFNSEKLLPKVLSAIKEQTFPVSKMEILVVDGGSVDNTREVAKKFGCTVIHNPNTVPAWAKYLGYKAAKGNYVMFLDSDEVMESNKSIEKKINLLKLNQHVYAVTGSGYKTPPGYFFINQYINEFGDPFSYFFYHLTKDSRFFLNAMKNHYTVVSESEENVLFDFSDASVLPIFELVAMGSIVDITYLKKEFPKIMTNPGLIPHLFNLLVSKGSYIGIVKNDSLVHYSADTWKKYLGKIRSRIVNNIYTPAKEGFNGRVEFLPYRIRLKKYLFIPYSFSLIFPLLDAIYLMATRKRIEYIVHVPLCLYTSCLILYTLFMKKMGVPYISKSYGEEKNVTI